LTVNTPQGFIYYLLYKSLYPWDFNEYEIHRIFFSAFSFNLSKIYKTTILYNLFIVCREMVRILSPSTCVFNEKMTLPHPALYTRLVWSLGLLFNMNGDIAVSCDINESDLSNFHNYTKWCLIHHPNGPYQTEI
jgi:hypothetical protein